MIGGKGLDEGEGLDRSALLPGVSYGVGGGSGWWEVRLSGGQFGGSSGLGRSRLAWAATDVNSKPVNQAMLDS